MRRFVLAALVVVGCGGDPEEMNSAPQVVSPIPDQEIMEEDTGKVDLSRHFTDSDEEDTLKYTTQASSTVVSLSTQGHILVLVGVSAGEANVVVVARDPDGAEAVDTFKVTVTALPVNNAPVVEKGFDGVQFQQFEYVRYILSEYFSDPDGDDLTYSFETDTTVAGTSVSGGVLTVRSRGPGETTVAVTATDPGGLSASSDLSVLVFAGFFEDFTELEELVFWGTENVSGSLSEDGLRTSLDAGWCGHVFKEVWTEFESWKIEASMGRDDNEDESAPYLAIGIGDNDYLAYRIMFGDGLRVEGSPVNWRLDRLQANEVWDPLVSGDSEDLDEQGYEVSDVSIEYNAGTDSLTATVGDLTLVEWDMSEEGYPTVATDVAALGVCTLSGQSADGATALVENAALSGDTLSGGQ